jgi:hypothetical protein
LCEALSVRAAGALVAFFVAFFTTFGAAFFAAFFVAGIQDPVRMDNNGRTTRYRPGPPPTQFTRVHDVGDIA